MKEINKKCWSCAWFHNYYVKGIYKFDRKELGECAMHDTIVSQYDTCEQWKNAVSLKKLNKDFAINYLNEIYNRLTVIEEIIKEANELTKIQNE